MEDRRRWNLIEAAVGLGGFPLACVDNLDGFEVEVGRIEAASEGDTEDASEGFMANNILIRSSYVSC